MAIINPDYSADDFKQATAALLPPGEYWSYQSDGQLNDLLSGLAIEFKTTHDETQQNILYRADNTQAGWKLSDYQTLLDSHHVTGYVFDDSSAPNLIYINVNAGSFVGELMETLEDYRLPHTAFLWTIGQEKKLYLGSGCRRVCASRNKKTAQCWELEHSQVLYAMPARQGLKVHRRAIVAQYLDEYPVQFIAHQTTVYLAESRNRLVIHRTQMRAI